MKLLLADDHALFRDTLAQYIGSAEPKAEITLAGDFHEALNCLNRNPNYDLVLLDLRMPGMNGIEGFKTIRRQFPDMPVALLTGYAESSDIKGVMDLGAAGYFPKTMSGKTLLKAIQLVLSGERFIPIDQKTNGIMPAYHGEKPSFANGDFYGTLKPGNDSHAPRVSRLTPREEEVLSFLIKGESNKDIANALGLQVVTVKLHVRGICRKLNAKNRTQAALKARELGLAS